MDAPVLPAVADHGVQNPTSQMTLELPESLSRSRFTVTKPKDECLELLSIDNGSDGARNGRAATIGSYSVTIEEPRWHVLPKVPPSKKHTDRDGGFWYPAWARTHRYRRFQNRVYQFLDRPRDTVSIVYHTIEFLIILLSLCVGVLNSLEMFRANLILPKMLFFMEVCLLVIFALEYCLRLWACGTHGSYENIVGRLRFIRKPYMIIDLIVMSATCVSIYYHQDAESGFVSKTGSLTFLRFLQVLRVLRFDRQRGAFKIISTVIYEHRHELLTCMYMSFIILITLAFLIYLAEQNSTDSKINNLADSLYYGVITLLTIGYGDLSPVTWVGKLLCCLFSVLGTAFATLPAGIIGSGFALQVAQQQRQKHYNNRKVPAAIIIQRFWRWSCAQPGSLSNVTWRLHQEKIYRLQPDMRTTLPEKSTKTITVLASNRVAAVLRRNANVPNIPKVRKASSVTDINQNSEPLRSRTEANTTENQVDANLMTWGYHSKAELQVTYKSLSNTQKNCIRFFRKVHCLIAINKFKEARRPYDVKDVLEQYASGQLEMFSRIKALQYRIDAMLGIQTPKDSRRERLDESKALSEITKCNILSRISKMETKVESLDRKLDMLAQLMREMITRQGSSLQSESSATNLGVPIVDRHS